MRSGGYGSKHVFGGSLVKAVVAALLASTSSVAFAQTDDIVVTAERRDATVQKTGLSITALKGSDLQQAGLTSVQAVIQQVPGVSFKTGGPGQTELEMRGLNSGGGNSPTVGFYLDDTPLTSFAFATSGKVVIDPDLYDLSRVEVLRGPQGTLYGAGSMGGTVRLLTNQPGLDRFEFSGLLEGSGTRRGSANGTASAMINVPLMAGKAALRIVGTEKYVDGWIDRVVLGAFPKPGDPSGVGFKTIRGDVESVAVQKAVANANSVHLQGIRATLLLEPTGGLRITPMVMYQKIHADGQSLIDGVQTLPSLRSANDARYRTLQASYQPLDTPEPVDDAFRLTSLTANLDLGGVELVSVSSAWKRTLQQVQDGSEVMQYVLQMPSFYTPGGGLGSGPWIERDSARQFSEEVRLTSVGDTPFKWILGGFYGDLHSVQHQYANYLDRAAVANFAKVDPLAIDAGGKATSLDQTVDQAIRQSAVFGEVSYEFAHRLKVATGLRYFDFRSHAATSEFGLFAPEGNLVPGNHEIDEHDHGFNPRFNATWLPSDNLTIYGTVAKGFRPGGTNQVIPTTGVAAGGTPEGDACSASLSSFGRKTNPTSFQPDSVWSYEAGEKARLAGGRITVNSAAYFQKWSNIQRSITLGCAFIYSDNAGSADIYGGELEIAARISSTLRLSVNAGYTHATYDDISMLPTAAGLVSRTGVQKGQNLPDVPRFTSSQTILYTKPLSDALTLTGQIMNSYVGSREETTSAFTNGAGNSSIPVDLGQYDLVSARIGVGHRAGWNMILFIDNLTNNQTPVSAINSQVLNITPIRRLTIGRPRTVGATLSCRY